MPLDVHPLDAIVFVFITTLTLVYTIYLCRKHRENELVDYLLFGRKLTLPLFVTTLVTTWYGDVFGITQIAFKKGIYAVMVYGVGFYLAAVVFMCFFVVKARGMSAFSIPDIIEKTYGKIAAKIVSVMVMVRVLPVSYTIGIGLLLKQLFGWDMDVAMLSGLLFCIGYIGVRGFSGIVYSDAIQFVLMFVSVIMVVVFSFIEYGGFGYLSENLDPSYFSIHGGENLSELLVWFFIAVIATFMSPVFYQRCFAAKSTQVAKYGIFISIICWMFFDFCTITGSMYAKAMTSEAAPHEAYFNYAMNMLPIGFRGVFLSGIAATILSTLDSFLFICSATLVYDLLGPKYTLNYVFKIGALVLIGGVTFFLASHFIDSIDKFYIMMKGYFGVTLAIPLMLTILFGRIANEVQFLSVIVLTILGMLVNDFILDMPVVRSFYVGSMVSLVGFFIFYVINLYCARHKIIGRMAK